MTNKRGNKKKYSQRRNKGKSKEELKPIETVPEEESDEPAPSCSYTVDFPCGSSHRRKSGRTQRLGQQLNNWDIHLFKLLPPKITLEDVNAAPVRCHLQWHTKKSLNRRQCLHNMIYAMRPNAVMGDPLNRELRKIVLVALNTESIMFQTAESWEDYMNSVNVFISSHMKGYRSAENSANSESSESSGRCIIRRSPIEIEQVSKSRDSDSSSKDESSLSLLELPRPSRPPLVSTDSTETDSSSSNEPFRPDMTIGMVSALPAEQTREWHRNFSINFRNNFILLFLPVGYGYNPDRSLDYAWADVARRVMEFELDTYIHVNTRDEYLQIMTETVLVTLKDLRGRCRNLPSDIHSTCSERESNVEEQSEVESESLVEQGPQPMYADEFYVELTRQHLQLCVHSIFCKLGISQCSFPYCDAMKVVLLHFRSCDKGRECMVPHCSSSHQLVEHWLNCVDKECPICSASREESLLY